VKKDIQGTGRRKTYKAQGEERHTRHRAKKDIQGTGRRKTYKAQGEERHTRHRAKKDIQGTGRRKTYKAQGEERQNTTTEKTKKMNNTDPPTTGDEQYGLTNNR
jgi:hypothetical protein